MKEQSLNYTAENLGNFFADYFSKYQNMRLGQAACYVFIDIPKDIQDKIFYAEDQKWIGQQLWNGLFL